VRDREWEMESRVVVEEDLAGDWGFRRGSEE